MKFSRIVTLFCVLAALAAMAWAADVTGKWVAQVPGRGGQGMETTFNFTQSGEQLTGTIVTQRGESKISDGKVSGDDISFSQVLEFGGNQMKFLYKGKVAGNEIKFTREREGGQRGQEFTAKKS